MPELTHESATPPPVGPFAFEDHEGFRETLLIHFTRPGDAEAMRRFGAMLYESALECAPSWPEWSESSTRVELRAAAADLRHLHGFLAAVGQEHEVTSLALSDAHLSRFAGRQAEEVRKIADRIEGELADSPGETDEA